MEKRDCTKEELVRLIEWHAYICYWKVPYLQSTITTMMTMMMMVTTRIGTITPAMTAILLLPVGNCVVVPSV